MVVERPHETLVKQVGAVRWRYGIYAALAMACLALLPQAYLCARTGRQWNGSVAYFVRLGDEPAYAAYINALINGRPRRNDPYAGCDDSAAQPLAENHLSIQFIPAYLVAWPARLLGLNGATAFILLAPVSAFLATLALFWFFSVVTRDGKMSAVMTLFVLCLGALVTGEGLVAYLTSEKVHFGHLPFLRRYQPSASFPFLFLLFGFVWLALTKDRRRLVYSVLAGVSLALLIYSYFYLWTAALAWVLALGSGQFIIYREQRRIVCQSLAVILGLGALSLAPYAGLLRNRAAHSDSFQVLTLTHEPDLGRVTVLAGLLILLLIAIAYSKKWPVSREKAIVLVMAFAAVPLMVFNQQVITGRVLQPIHYQGFAANYAVLLALALSGWLIKQRHEAQGRRIPPRLLLWIVLAVFEWGFLETYVVVKGGYPINLATNQHTVVLNYLAKLTPPPGSYPTVLFSDLAVADEAPPVIPQAVLWAPHLFNFSCADAQENKRRLYRHLYYTGVSVEALRQHLASRNYYGYAVGLFGMERVVDGLSPNPQPVTPAELEAALSEYGRYLQQFGPREAAAPQLSLIVVPLEKPPDLSNLDRWYRRDAGTQIGNYVVYRVTPLKSG
jgi:hypothetical protein